MCVGYRQLNTSGEPVSKPVVHRERQVMFVVIAVVICIFTAVIISALVCIYCRYGRFVLVPKISVAGYRTRKRVVVMHSNVFYHPGGSGSGKDSDVTAPFLPVVKIEAGLTRLTSQSTGVSDYEIPLDKDWEFPRNKSV